MSWGCASPVTQVQVTVRPTPIAEAGPNFTICEGDTLQLQGSYGYTTTEPADPSQVYFAWVPANTLNDSTLVQPWATPTQSTVYVLDVRYTLCHTQDSMLVTVIPTQQPAVSADTNVTCQGDPVQLHVSGGLGNALYQWSPATGLDDPQSTDPFATPDSSTVYTVTMQEGGCVTRAQVALEVVPSPIASFLNSTQLGCSPFPVSFVSNSENTIHHIWNFGDGQISNETMPVHTYDEAGTYTVTLIAVQTRPPWPISR
jgi:PKD domain